MQAAPPLSSGPLQPFRKLLQSDDVPVALLFHLPGLFAPGVEIRVGDAPGPYPGKTPLVLLPVNFEHRIVGLFLRPLLEGPRLPAGLLSPGHRALTVLRANPSGLGKPAAAVLAAPHRDAPLYAAAQGIVDHVRNAGGV